MPTVKLHANKYEELILRRGRKVAWQESAVCSCMNHGHPRHDCQACKGIGRTLSEPIEDLALLMSITNNQEYEAMAGIFQVGDAVLTVGKYVPEVNLQTNNLNRMSRGRVNPLFDIGEGDIITLTDDEYKTSEVLTMGEPIYAREADTLLNEEVVEVLRIQQSNIVTGEITVYTKDIDYTSEGNKIVWLGVNQPERGETYTVIYTHRPVFVVFTQLPTPRYQDGQDLPKKVALRYRAGGIDTR